MGGECFFFAGGGTGGHIYPGIAVAEQLIKLEPQVGVRFFCSNRSIDSHILTQTSFEYTQLPAKGFSLRPKNLIGFCSSFLDSYRIAKKTIAATNNAVVVGVGGFVAGPVSLAAHRLTVPIALVNVDILPGRANKIIARWAEKVFVQFEETAANFGKRKDKVSVVGCPLRGDFENPDAAKVKQELGLDSVKKILLVTGASSGSANINEAICRLLEKLDAFADEWQIVHLTGRANLEEVKGKYSNSRISHKVVDYWDDMPDLLAAADLAVGRSGAVSVAEYAAAAVPSICMPYPYHKDRHQYLNAGKLVEAGAAIIVDDLRDAKDRAEWLWEELEELLKDDKKRQEMKANCKMVAKKNAAIKIAKQLLQI